MSAPGRDTKLDHELNRALDSCGVVTHCDSVGLATVAEVVRAFRRREVVERRTMRRNPASTVRSFGFRISVFIFANTCSLGHSSRRNFRRTRPAAACGAGCGSSRTGGQPPPRDRRAGQSGERSGLSLTRRSNAERRHNSLISRQRQGPITPIHTVWKIEYQKLARRRRFGHDQMDGPSCAQRYKK